jgi:hypothetical protein
LNAALAAAQDQRIRAQARWQQASSGAMPADMIGNSNIRALQSQKAQLQGTYQLKLQTFKPDYPEMLQLKGQLDELDRQIAQETRGVRASVQAEYSAAATQERMLMGQIASLRTQALDVDGRSIQYNILKREADTNRQIYDSLLQRFKEVGVAGGVRANNVSIIDRAQTAWRVKPDLFTNVFLGLLLGFDAGRAGCTSDGVPGRHHQDSVGCRAEAQAGRAWRDSEAGSEGERQRGSSEPAILVLGSVPLGADIPAVLHRPWRAEDPAGHEQPARARASRPRRWRWRATSPSWASACC